MQDLEGKIIQTTEGTKYVLTEIAGEGAQGVVYNEASDKFLIKLYNRSNPIQNKNRFDKLKWLISGSVHKTPSINRITICWVCYGEG